MSRTVIVIPARWGSTRFPGKPLHPIAGKPLIQHVWERCSRVKGADQILIATDDVRIFEAARAFGAEVAMTSSRHPSGTDRLAEAARNLPAADILLNVQGGEPGASSRRCEPILSPRCPPPPARWPQGLSLIHI